MNLALKKTKDKFIEMTDLKPEEVAKHSQHFGLAMCVIS